MDRVTAFRAIEASISDIARNGTLVCRNEPGRAPSWSLRFRNIVPETGARKHRRIDLGNDVELIDLARQAIGCRKRKRAEGREADAACAEESKQRRTMERELMNQTEGSRRYRQAVRGAFRDYCAVEPQPTVESFLYRLDEYDLSRRRSGRPLKSRLW